LALAAGQPWVIRFGAFEVDAAGGELRKAGIPQKLHPQPLRVLLLLAERSGQIVTREEIRRYLWGTNTFVDFDRGINFCINQIRTALADNAENPRYIQTLPGRGYRFIASVTRTDPRTFPIPFERAAVVQAQPHPTVAAEEARLASSKEPRIEPIRLPVFVLRRLIRTNLTAALAALSAIVLFAAGIISYFRRPAKLTERDTIVLADFLNNTGDPVFDDSLRQAMAIALEQSPFLNVLSEKRTNEVLRMMGRPENERTSTELGEEVCLRTGSKALLSGRISRLGGHYLVDLNAVACSNGDTLAEEQIEGASKEEVLRSLSRAASRLREKLGESLPSVQKLDVPIEATTTSLEALQNYSRATRIGYEYGDAPVIPLLKRAIELDPHFAMAYVGLARRYSNLDQPSVSLAYATKAYELRDRVTEYERLWISAAYFRATGALEKMSQVLELWTAEYPHDRQPHSSLSAIYSYLGQYDKALAEAQQALRLSPDDVMIYANLSGAYLDLNQLDKAQAVFDQAKARGLEGGGLHVEMYYLAFQRGDPAQMAQQVAWGLGKPDDEARLLSLQSESEAYYGRLNKARDLSQRAVAAAIRSNSKEQGALWQVIAALREAEFGETAEAKRDVARALALADGRDVKVLAAVALARMGESTRARGLAEELQKANPSNTLLKVYWLPVIQAATALKEGKAARALRMLKFAAPYELGHSLSLDRGTLYPCYLRGQAYLMAHHGAAATAEYQKLLDHSGIAMNFVTESLARLQIARAYALAGDTAKAKAAYQVFLTLWKDADPTIPILRQAKAEYAKLK